MDSAIGQTWRHMVRFPRPQGQTGRFGLQELLTRRGLFLFRFIGPAAARIRHWAQPRARSGLRQVHRRTDSLSIARGPVYVAGRVPLPGHVTGFVLRLNRMRIESYKRIGGTDETRFSGITAGLEGSLIVCGSSSSRDFPGQRIRSGALLEQRKRHWCCCASLGKTDRFCMAPFSGTTRRLTLHQ